MISFAWYRKFVVIASVSIFFTSFSDYSERWGLNPLFWIIVICGLASPLVINAVFSSAFEMQPLIFWGLGYLLVSIIWYFPSPQDSNAFRQLRLRVLSVIFLFLMLFLLRRPEEQQLARVMVALGVLLAVSLNIYEQFHPMTFSPVPGRSEGLYANINQSGAALMLGMIVSQSIIPSKLRLPFNLITAIGIITTFSRAAILGWILVVAYWTVRSGFGVAQMSRILIVVAIIFGFFASPYWSRLETKLEERGSLNLSVIQRLSFFSQGDTSDTSSAEREAVAVYAWRLFEQRPLIGWGTGYDRNLENFEVGTHNIYLAMMVDHGIFGVFIMPLLLVCALWKSKRHLLDLVAPFAIFATMWGFFSHNELEERYILLCVALVGSMVLDARAAEKRSARERVPAPIPIPLGAPA